jgi:hypothetical protein
MSTNRKLTQADADAINAVHAFSQNCARLDFLRRKCVEAVTLRDGPLENNPTKIKEVKKK